MKETRLTTRTNVLEFLENANSSHAARFQVLFDNGKNGPLKSLSGGAKERFVDNAGDIPTMGKQQSPFKTPPSIDEVQDILLRDLHNAGGGSSHYIPKTWLDNDHMDTGVSADIAAQELIANLANPDFESDGIVSQLPSQDLDDLAVNKIVPEKNMLQTSMTCTVIPHDTILTLQHHNETTSYTTMLAGAIVWLIWPPSMENLDILKQAYDVFAQGANDVDDSPQELIKSLMAVADDLAGGVMFVQTPGNGLRIPPYCIMLGLATQTSAMAHYCFLTAYNLVHMLTKIPLLVSAYKTEAKGEQQLRTLAAALPEQVRRTLLGEFEDFPAIHFLKKENTDKEGPLKELVQVWDEVKDDVAGMLDAESASKMMNEWIRFLKIVVGRNCAICGRRFHNKGLDVTTHFRKKHWSEETAPTHVESMEGVTMAEDSEAPAEAEEAGGSSDESELSDALENLSELMVD